MLTVSNYHYIRENFRSIYPSIFGVTPKKFENQLKLFKNTGDFISISDLNSDFQNILASSENYFLVTFDDGLKEQYKFALPIMESLNIEGYFFVNSINSKEYKVSLVHKIHLLRSMINPHAFLKEMILASNINYLEKYKKRATVIYRYDKKNSAYLKFFLNFLMPFKLKEVIINQLFDNYFNENETVEKLYMNKDNIIKLAERGYLGSHSYNHYPLGLLKEKEIIFELEDSKKYFENLTKKTINAISYPYGTKEACTDKVLSLTEKADYSFGFTTLRGKNKLGQNRLFMNRFDCNDLIGGKSYGN